ncbi:hypothetical protein [Rhodopseudomonas sp. BR0G17]|uniref:hypothetical protein n=1 Tax=Rhodopseudomonas sp. BR0G17 TaxID=2269368 RepID=UPI0013DF3D68|nr:hypothetical protein [Rhodopseudomonas sp. BR0G17]NEW96640.1 hypothetical protein [Rhodopseudomonas sp. BR0G17]
MASPFDRAIAAAAVTHDSIMGEAFEIRPQKFQTDRNAPLIADPARGVVTVKCPWVDAAARAGAGPFHQVGVQPERPGHSTSRPSISINMTLLPFALRQGDLVFRVKTQALYRVFELLPSTPGFARISLNKV